MQDRQEDKKPEAEETTQNENTNEETPVEAQDVVSPREGESNPNPNFRPLARGERRNLWLRDYGDQDFALQMWVRLVELQDVEIEMMLQMHGILAFGTLVSTTHYAQFYIDMNEELYRENDPAMADFFLQYYRSLVPPAEQEEFGPEGLPVLFRFAHMRDVTLMSGGNKVKVPYWRGKINDVEAFVVGATAEA
ncbi:MAG TPA: hypothetical protein VFN23_19080 [Ktedonobacteraceae bacterium]|nr:hypothetical protein [Ktedonobacteraceae bacterium]